MNWQKLVEDGSKCVADVETLIADLTVLVNDLKAQGVDAQAFFASYAGGPAFAMAAPVGVSAIDWQKWINLLLKYGPILYGILAKIFGWPPIPFPIPAPTE